MGTGYSCSPRTRNGPRLVTSASLKDLEISRSETTVAALKEMLEVVEEQQDFALSLGIPERPRERPPAPPVAQVRLDGWEHQSGSRKRARSTKRRHLQNSWRRVPLPPMPCGSCRCPGSGSVTRRTVGARRTGLLLRLRVPVQ